MATKSIQQQLLGMPGLVQKVEAELARRTLRGYVEYMWPLVEPGKKFIPGWPIDAMCEHLEAVTRGEIKNLLINVPPGSMKSLLVRVFWPTWEWIHYPYHRYIGASYAQHLAERDNRRARELVMSRRYQDHFDVELTKEQSTKTNFVNKKAGWMFATTIRGIGTGERGSRFIIDDPHNVLESESPAIRLEAIRWFREVVPSRLNDMDRDPIVVVMQRVHQEDVSSAALELGYEHLMIPMHWDESRRVHTSIGWTDPRTEDNELMWPERFSAKAVKSLEDALGVYAASAQLEQSPVPRVGGMFRVDQINLVDELPEGNYAWVRAWDLAASEGEGAYTVGVKMAVNLDDKRVFIVDVRRDRLASGGVRRLIRSTAEMDGVSVPIRVPQDPGQAGKDQAKDMITQDLFGYDARAELQSGAKETRAEPLAAQVEIGNVYVLKRAWTQSFLEEIRFFPKGKYSDQADAASSAYNALSHIIRRGRRPELTLVSGRQTNWTEVS